MGQHHSCLSNTQQSPHNDNKSITPHRQEQRRRKEYRDQKNDSWTVLISECNKPNASSGDVSAIQREIFVGRAGNDLHGKKKKKKKWLGSGGEPRKERKKITMTTMEREINKKEIMDDEITRNYGDILEREFYTPEAILESKEHPAPLHPIDTTNRIYAIDLNLTPSKCQNLITLSERCSRGSYTSYTYAKQTLSIREYPDLAAECSPFVHRAVSTIRSIDNRNLVLDDREPHIVKYDLIRRERQKLDMHTDKSEWTFLIALSESGLDYTGGGTFFECNGSVVNVGLGMGVIFPGKLRHRGEKIDSGRRFLIVGFMIEKKIENDENVMILTSSDSIDNDSAMK